MKRALYIIFFILLACGAYAPPSPAGDKVFAQGPYMRQTSFAALNGVCYSSDLNLFVAVGNNGTILTSSDGNSWMRRNITINCNLANINSNANYKAVAWGGKLGKFVIANGQSIITSGDGVQWTVSSLPKGLNLTTICWDGNRFIAGGDNGSVYATSDLATWTSLNQNVYNAYQWQGIASDGASKYLAYNGNVLAGSSRASVISADSGGTWSTTSNYFYNHNDTVWSATQKKFVACGGGASKAGYATLESGNTWSVKYPDTSVVYSSNRTTNGTTFNGLATSGSKFIFVSGNGLVLCRNDDGSFSASTALTEVAPQSGVNTDRLNAVAYGSGRFIAVGGTARGVILNIAGDGSSYAQVKECSAVIGLEKPDYLQYFTGTYKKPDLNYMKGQIDDPRDLAIPAAHAIRMYQITGEQKYLDDSADIWNTLFSLWESNPNYYKAHQNSFFVEDPLLEAYAGLKAAGRVDAASESTLNDYLTNGAGFVWQLEDNNQGLSRAAGIARAISLFPNHSNVAQWRQYVDAVWNYWYGNLGLDENATLYNAIGLNSLIKIAKLTGREGLLANPEVQKMFARFRDQLAPSGAMPEYGDAYFDEDTVGWVYIFEYAARKYNDPTFLDAAWRAFWYNKYNSFTGDLDSQVLFLSNYNPPVVGTQASSYVATRNAPGHFEVMDKLFLGPNRQSGAPFAMTELYGKGFHSHRNRIGAVMYYEAGNAALFHGLTRHNTSATQSNILAVGPSSGNFPYTDHTMHANTWYHETIPSRMLMKDCDGNVNFDKLTLRLQLNNANSTGQYFIIDNLRLEGPAGVKKIDDFESLAQWTRNDNPYSLTTDCTSGSYALKVAITGSNCFYTNAGYNLQFNIKDYSSVKYDWKYVSPTDSPQFSYLFRVKITPDSGVPYDVDTYPLDVNNVPAVNNVAVDVNGNDSFGQIDMGEYFGYDNSLSRKIVLTNEGVMVIQDTLTPGQSAANQVAGPIWNLYSSGARGTNWFDSPGEPAGWYDYNGIASANNSTFVYFEQSSSRSFGIDYTNNNGVAAYTAYAKQALTPGSPVTFVTVLVPHSADVAADSLANGITVNTNRNSETYVTVSLPETNLHIKVGGWGVWSVSRSAPLTPKVYFGSAELNYSDGSPVSRLEGGKMLTASIDVTSDMPTLLTAQIIAALYNKNGVLIKASRSDGVVKTIGFEPVKYSVSIDVPLNAQNCYVKVFLWDNIKGLRPLTCPGVFFK